VPTISLPTDDAPQWTGDLPAGVEIVIWDGTGERPGNADAIELFVGRYDAAPPAADVLAALPALRVIQLVSAGVESWLPVVPDGVLLCNGRGVHGASTAELAVAGLLAVLRELPRFATAQRDHDWAPARVDGVTGRHVLIVGAGDIGRRVGAAVQAFDADVTYVARTARTGVGGDPDAVVRAIDDLPALLPVHDVVVLALPSTPDTAGLVGADFLAAMRDSAVLVNVARGAIVQTDALVAELRAHRLRAFLDVTDPEPLPPEHPLWDAPNLLLTPHVGGGTRGWEERAYALVREQVRRYLAGEPLDNQVAHGY
jgi:phosphoglycerate dehydrogenase-like enzyme